MTLARKTPLKSTGTLKRAPMKRRRKKHREGWNKTGDAYYSRAHLDFVKSHRCCVPVCSNTETDPHHIHKLRSGGGMSLQCSDLDTVPVCRRHHDEWDDHRRIKPWTTDETVAFFQRIARNLVRLSIKAGVLPEEVNSGR